MKSVNTLFISLKINAILPIIILLRSFSLDSEFPVSGTFESEVGPGGAGGPQEPEAEEGPSEGPEEGFEPPPLPSSSFDENVLGLLLRRRL